MPKKRIEPSDEQIILELESAKDRVQAREVRKRYAKSRFAGKESIRLLSSLEQLAFYFQILAFAAYLFAGYALYSGRIVYAIYEISVFSGIFLLAFSVVGIVYAIVKSAVSKANVIPFVVISVLRMVITIALLAVEAVLKSLSSGGLFNV